MPRIKTLTLALSAIFMMAGCASTQTSVQNGLKKEPLQKVVHGAGGASAFYQLGRYYQGRARNDLALPAYQQALALEPRHIGALTGIGVVYANLGEYDASLRLLAAAAEFDPGSASARNNLGYIHWLRDERDAALAAYRQALKLDPINARARANLRKIMKDAANDPPSTSAPVPAGAVSRASPPAAPLPQLAPQVYELRAPAHGGSRDIAPAAVSRVALKEVGPRVYELRRPAEITREPVEAAPAVARKPGEQPAIADAAPKPFSLEVANGNGVKGAARKTAGYLSGRGYRATRVYDLRPFNKAVSRIEYRKGYESEAIKLGAELPGRVVYVESDTLRSNLRLVLGHDLKNNLAWSQWLQSLKLAAAESAPRL